MPDADEGPTGVACDGQASGAPGGVGRENGADPVTGRGVPRLECPAGLTDGFAHAHQQAPRASGCC